MTSNEEGATVVGITHHQVVVKIRGLLPGRESTTAEELLQEYMHVQRCWNNYDLAIKDSMTTERAIKTLVRIRDSNLVPMSLRRRSATLLDAVIYRQPEVLMK